MSRNLILIASALATLAALPLPAVAAGEKEKCYGIAKAGKNDCAASDGSHSCATKAKVNNAAPDWVYVAKGTCTGEGGKTSAPTNK